MKSTVRLFKAFPIVKKGKGKMNKALLKETIKLGFIFSPEVIFNYSERDLIQKIKIIESEIGLSAEKMNNAFHKSWKKIKEADIEQLAIEQILHYITTYGFERLGIYDQDLVYIPAEKLKIPKTNIDKISLVVIRGYTKDELKTKVLDLLASGIALSEDTKKDMIDVATFVGFNEKEVSEIKNKEIRVALYDYLDMFPENPIEFLRFLIYKSTNKTLLIKDKITIEEIKTKDNLIILNLLTKYQNRHGLERLAEIFLRFKPLWLAFRTNTGIKAVINKIRKLAVQYHKPMPEDYLNEVTAKIKKGEKISRVMLISELDKVNIFRKIRLVYALKFRTGDAGSILYRIRNGKGYATDFTFNRHADAKKILGVVLDSVIEDIASNIKGKKIYIPKNIIYALPATEKQFTGDFPSGSCVSIPKDMVVGIHWENVEHNRIDLDLSLINLKGTKIGWDRHCRLGGDVLFSGDMTDAQLPNGASEFFYVNKQKETAYILLVNYYNYDEKVEIPFKIIVASEKIGEFKQNYMVNPNNIIAIAKTKINQRQKVLGLLVISDNECRFYFTEAYLGKTITSSDSPYIQHSKKYLFDFYSNTISLNEILEKAGAKIITNKEKCDIDLAPENIEKDSILNLIK
jgi:hypothetical protein